MAETLMDAAVLDLIDRRMERCKDIPMIWNQLLGLRHEIDLLARIKAAGDGGLTLPKHDPVADRLSGSKQIAFRIVTSHGDCLQDDVNLDDLIDDIAAAIQHAFDLGFKADGGSIMPIVAR